jgi:hypothetical protein
MFQSTSGTESMRRVAIFIEDRSPTVLLILDIRLIHHTAGNIHYASSRGVYISTHQKEHVEITCSFLNVVRFDVW